IFRRQIMGAVVAYVAARPRRGGLVDTVDVTAIALVIDTAGIIPTGGQCRAVGVRLRRCWPRTAAQPGQQANDQRRFRAFHTRDPVMPGIRLVARLAVAPGMGSGETETRSRRSGPPR